MQKIISTDGVKVTLFVLLIVALLICSSAKARPGTYAKSLAPRVILRSSIEFRYFKDVVSKRNSYARYQCSTNIAPGGEECFTCSDRLTHRAFRDQSQIIADLNKEIKLVPDKHLETHFAFPANLRQFTGGKIKILADFYQQADIRNLANELADYDNFINGSPLIVDGDDVIKNASASLGQQGPAVDLSLTPAGTVKLAKFSTEHVNELMAIIIDGKVLSAANINEPLTDGTCEISGGFSNLAEARRLAAKINGTPYVAKPDLWKGLTSSSPIASIGPKSILYSDVMMPDEQAVDTFISRTGHLPSGENDEQMAEIKHDGEVRKLKRILNKAVLSSSLVRRDIVVTQSEIDGYKPYLPPGMTNEKLDALRKTQAAKLTHFADAIEAVRADGLDKTDAYQKYAAGYGSFGEWQFYCDHTLRPEQWEQMRKQGLRDGANPTFQPGAPYVKQILEDDKQAAICDKEIASADPVFARDLIITRGGPPVTIDQLEKAESVPPQIKTVNEIKAEDYIVAARHKWRMNEAAAANIKILAPCFQPALAP